MRRKKSFGIALLLLCGGVSPLVIAQAAPDSLLENFRSPPHSSRPLVWWHWMDGNVSKRGIELDLRWMRSVGIGGVQTFDAALDSPNIVGERLAFMQPKWNDAFRYAVTLADQLGLEFGIGSTPGWSTAGGPWVTASQGMKRLVWSETRVSGGTSFLGRLAPPPDIASPFQGAPVSRSLFDGHSAVSTGRFYRDVAVIAYRLPAGDLSSPELHPLVTSSAGRINPRFLWDGDFTTAVTLPFVAPGERAWIQLELQRPVTIRSMSLALGSGSIFADPYVAAELQVSSDGLHYHTVAKAYNTQDSQQTLAFAPARGRYFRLALPNPPTVRVPATFASLAPASPVEHRVMEWVLYTTHRVAHFEQKAGFFIGSITDDTPIQLKQSRDGIPGRDILQLTSRLHPDGLLEWSVPPGRWAVLRMGYAALGTLNHPASAEATGLEVDKLSRTAVQTYFNNYLRRYEAVVGPQLVGRRGVRAVINDSWEAGAQNWTDDLPAEFLRRRGYDIFPWLPALVGRVVLSSEETERFLWDFRRTLAELVADYYFGQMADLLHRRGLIVYGESHETGRAFLGDGMDAKRDVDVPMGALWGNEEFVSQKQGDADVRESASVAHLYGKSLVAAESMTAVGTPGVAYAFSPEDLKVTADRELTEGVNRFVIHTSVHQPLTDRGPGLTLGPYGQWFTRNETWAKDAGPWLTYLARCSYLLQQGRFVADVLYYYGQDSNITALYGDRLPAIPQGYAFDFANDTVLTRLTVHDGQLVSGGGMRYRVLVLDGRTTLMSLDVLKQLARLVADGAVVVGARPHSTPSFADNLQEFHALANSMWGPGKTAKHRFGRGWIFGAQKLAAALSDLEVVPDFSYLDRTPGSDIRFVHRQLEDGDLYFLSNRSNVPLTTEASFRVSGRVPELWHADTGAVEAAGYHQELRQVHVPLHFEPHDSEFVVFRKTALRPELTSLPPTRRDLLALNGPWHAYFPAGTGAPTHAVFTVLQSWSANADPGIRYFSGTVRYETTLKVQPAWLSGDFHLELDLGTVKNVAEVTLDGKPVGVAWKRPYRIDVTRFLTPGINRLTVGVTNLWPNRLIGDKQPGVASPTAHTTFNPYSADSTLLESGLIGPVTLVSVSAGGSAHQVVE